MRLAEFLITVGLILSIIGGVDAGTHFGKTGSYRPETLSQVGLGLTIAAFALLILTVLTLSMSIHHAERSERRILLAVETSLPFLLVWTIYSALAVFANMRGFQLWGGDVTTLLCMALLQEAVVVVLYEGVGLTLKKEKNLIVEPGASGEEAMAGSESELKPVDKEQKGWLRRLWPVVNLSATRELELVYGGKLWVCLSREIHIRNHDFGKMHKNARRMRLSMHAPQSNRMIVKPQDEVNHRGCPPEFAPCQSMG